MPEISWTDTKLFFSVCAGEVNEYDVYEIEYEPEGATSDEEQFESNSSKKAGNNKAKKLLRTIAKHFTDTLDEVSN